MSEFRLILSFAYLDPLVAVIRDEPEWESVEPYEEDFRFASEDKAREMYNEAKAILADPKASDDDPTQAQQDFVTKHGIGMRDFDGNDMEDAKLALIEIVDFLRVENLIEEEE